MSQDGSSVDPGKEGSTKVTGHPCSIIYRPCVRESTVVYESKTIIDHGTPPPKRPCPPKLLGPCPPEPWIPGKYKSGLNNVSQQSEAMLEGDQVSQQQEQQEKPEIQEQ